MAWWCRHFAYNVNRFVRTLQHAGASVVCVFDGLKPPQKAAKLRRAYDPRVARGDRRCVCASFSTGNRLTVSMVSRAQIQAAHEGPQAVVGGPRGGAVSISTAASWCHDENRSHHHAWCSHEAVQAGAQPKRRVCHPAAGTACTCAGAAQVRCPGCVRWQGLQSARNGL